MRILGVPAAELREVSGALRLLDVLWKEQIRAGIKGRGALRILVALPSVLRWGGVVTALLLSVPYLAMGVRPQRDGGTVLLGVVAAAFSMPLLRIQCATDLDAFLALASPSKPAVLLARWLGILPALALAGGTWAIFVAARIQPELGLASTSDILFLAEVGATPFLLAALHAWRSSHSDGSDERQSAFLRCLVLLTLFTALAVPLAVLGPGLVKHIAWIPGSFAGVLAFLAIVHLRAFAREGRGPAEVWRRAAFRVCLIEALSLAWAVVLVMVIPFASARSDPGSWERPLEALLGLVAVGMTGSLAALGAIRGMAQKEVPSREGRGKMVHAADSTPGERFDALLLVRRPRRPPIVAETAFTPPTVPWEGPWAGHVNSWREGLGWRTLKSPYVYLMAALVGALFLQPEPGFQFGATFLLGLFLPRTVRVAHGDRAYLLGMDLRAQLRHDLLALACFAAAPGLALAALLVWGRPGISWLPMTLWDPIPRWTPFAGMGSALLFRAGLPGVRHLARKVTRLAAYYSGLPLLIGLGGFTFLSFEGVERFVVPALLFAVPGIVGLGVLFTLTEETVREERLRNPW